MQSIDRLSRACFGLSAAIGLFIATPTTAIAQEDGADEALAEITVTARRREETLQDVPIAVTAFSGDYLDEIGMPDIVGITQSTPNVTLEVSRATSTTLTASDISVASR